MIKELGELASAVSSVYSITQPFAAMLMQAKREKMVDNLIVEISEADIEEILKEGLQEVISKNQDEFNKGCYEKVLSFNCIENLTNNVIEKYRGLNIFKEEVRKYIEKFVNNLIDVLAGKTNDSEMLKCIIQINKNNEYNAERRKEEIKEVLKLFVCRREDISKEKEDTSLEEISELPFEIENLVYSAELGKVKGKIEHRLDFRLSSKNYKVIQDSVYVATESAKGIWSFNGIGFPWMGSKRTEQNMKVYSDSVGMRKIEESGIVAFFKVYNRKNYYIRIFGDMNNLYYEQLTEDEYKVQKNKYKELYLKTEKKESQFEDWRKYNYSIMYTDFTF